jgi:hypothetical protein
MPICTTNKFSGCPTGHNKKSSGWPVSRILSNLRDPVYARRLRPGYHIWTVISLCSLPGTDSEASSFSSLFGLAPGGGCLAARIAADAGGLLHHLFTLTALPRRIVSVALVRQVSPSRDFPGAVLCGVRTFLDPTNAGPRPSGQPEDGGIIPSLGQSVNLKSVLILYILRGRAVS